jgi:hypothetical protein
MMFLRFSRDFTRTSKTHKLFKIRTFSQAHGSFLGPYLALKTLERKGAKQLGPRPWTPAVQSEFRRGPAGAWPGSGWGRG